MSLWSPYAFDALGNAPAGPTSPPVLRVEGAPASAAQLAGAQQVFAIFAQERRFSFVPNPTQSGALADGSTYKISTVGVQTVMQLWPVDKATKKPSSGILFPKTTSMAQYLLVNTGGEWLLKNIIPDYPNGVDLDGAKKLMASPPPGWDYAYEGSALGRYGHWQFRDTWPPANFLQVGADGVIYGVTAENTANLMVSKYVQRIGDFSPPPYGHKTPVLPDTLTVETRHTYTIEGWSRFRRLDPDAIPESFADERRNYVASPNARFAAIGYEKTPAVVTPNIRASGVSGICYTDTSPSVGTRYVYDSVRREYLLVWEAYVTRIPVTKSIPPSVVGAFRFAPEGISMLQEMPVGAVETRKIPNAFRWSLPGLPTQEIGTVVYPMVQLTAHDWIDRKILTHCSFSGFQQGTSGGEIYAVFYMEAIYQRDNSFMLEHHSENTATIVDAISNDGQLLTCETTSSYDYVYDCKNTVDSTMISTGSIRIGAQNMGEVAAVFPEVGKDQIFANAEITNTEVFDLETTITSDSLVKKTYHDGLEVVLEKVQLRGVRSGSGFNNYRRFQEVHNSTTRWAYTTHSEYREVLLRDQAAGLTVILERISDVSQTITGATSAGVTTQDVPPGVRTATARVVIKLKNRTDYSYVALTGYLVFNAPIGGLALAGDSDIDGIRMRGSAPPLDMDPIPYAAGDYIIDEYRLIAVGRPLNSGFKAIFAHCPNGGGGLLHISGLNATARSFLIDSEYGIRPVGDVDPPGGAGIWPGIAKAVFTTF